MITLKNYISFLILFLLAGECHAKSNLNRMVDVTIQKAANIDLSSNICSFDFAVASNKALGFSCSEEKKEHSQLAEAAFLLLVASAWADNDCSDFLNKGITLNNLPQLAVVDATIGKGCCVSCDSYDYNSTGTFLVKGRRIGSYVSNRLDSAIESLDSFNLLVPNTIFKRVGSLVLKTTPNSMFRDVFTHFDSNISQFLFLNTTIIEDIHFQAINVKRRILLGIMKVGSRLRTITINHLPDSINWSS